MNLPEKYLRTSHSQQKTLQRCPKKYEYHYVRNIRPQRDDNRFLLGRAVHEFLEHYYENLIEKDRETAYQAASRYFQAYIQANFPHDDEAHEQAILAEQMIHHYHEWAAKHDNFKVLGTEVNFEVKVADSVWRGYFDAVIEIGGKYWIMEHKTAKQMNTDHTLRDRQISVYVLAARKLDIPVEGVLYNTLKKAVPEKPKLLKSGKLSKAKNKNITYDSYMAAIEEHGHNPEGYQEILDELKGLENPFFQREFVPRTVENSKVTLQDVQQTETLKYLALQHGLFPRNATKDCSWDCPFNEICLAELEGSDTTVLFRDRYKTVNTEEEEEKVKT